MFFLKFCIFKGLIIRCFENSSKLSSKIHFHYDKICKKNGTIILLYFFVIVFEYVVVFNCEFILILCFCFFYSYSIHKFLLQQHFKVSSKLWGHLWVEIQIIKNYNSALFYDRIKDRFLYFKHFLLQIWFKNVVLGVIPKKLLSFHPHTYVFITNELWITSKAAVYVYSKTK